MRALHLNSSDEYGGAARAAFRLHKGLQSHGVDSRMLVQIKTGIDSAVYGPQDSLPVLFTKIWRFLDRLPVSIFLKRFQFFFHAQWVPDFLFEKINQSNPDLIHLHWICGGFVRIESLRNFGRPLIWTLHDMWPFTGGCHYAGDCGRYEHECGKCPQLRSRHIKDLSRWVWSRKQHAWEKTDMTIVTPSRWLASCAEKSALFKKRKIEVIPNGIDTNFYKPIEKEIARRRLGLPLEKNLVLFGAINAATERKKGLHLLKSSLISMRGNEQMKGLELVVFGSKKPKNEMELDYKVNYLGHITEEDQIVSLYSACDVFAAPTLEDNLPNTIMESMACGTPCVGFNIGGIPDMINHRHNGYLAKPSDTRDFAKGLCWVLSNDQRRYSLSMEARKKVQRDYRIELVTERYEKLYRDVIT